MTHTILIELEIKTTKGKEQINSAIQKGLYYGLDIKHVAEPKNVKITNVIITNK